jgi:glycosyltransferase involved in cell wall biosynthesis
MILQSNKCLSQSFKLLKALVFSLGFLFIICLHGNALEEKPMVVIIPSYNNIKWYKSNLDSVLTQDYSNYRVIYVDDRSSDGTAKAVEAYLARNDQNNRVQLFSNYERVGAMANLYGAIHSCSDDEVCVLLDGDDWLYDPSVLKQLNKAYSSGDIWFTHGTLMEYPMGHVTWCEPILPEAIANNSYREFKCPSHLRTFYAWLFKEIKLQDFLYQGGFLKMAWDMAIMYPLAEMAAERHAFIADVLYSYNMSNPNNDNKVNADLQNFWDRLIRNRPRYQRLESKPGR